MTHDVFISYSSVDKPIADAAVAILESENLRCWIAPRDVLPGKDWGEAIISGINHCQVMVLIFSSSANGSPSVIREVERAVSKGIPILPVRVEAVTPTGSMEFFLSIPHWLDALTPPLQDHLLRLARTIKDLLNSRSERRAPPQPTAGPSPAGPALVGPTTAEPGQTGKPPDESKPDDGHKRTKASRTGDPPPPRPDLHPQPPESASNRSVPPTEPVPTNSGPVSQVVTAQQLRELTALRARTLHDWDQVTQLPVEPGLEELAPQGAAVKARLELHFSKEEFVSAWDAARELSRLIAAAKGILSRRSNAEKWLREVERLDGEAKAFDAPRLCRDVYAHARLFAKQAEDSFRLAAFERAVEHWKEAITPFKRAVELASKARLAELQEFVSDTAQMLHASNGKPTKEQNAQVRQLAEKVNVRNKAAKRLIDQAWRHFRNPETPLIDSALVEEVLDLQNAGLGATRLQRMLIKPGSVKYWPLVVFGIYAILMLGILGSLIAGLYSEEYVAFAVTLVMFVILSGALLFVPIRVATRRSVTRRPIWVTLTAAAILIGIMVGFSISIVHDFTMVERNYVPVAPDGNEVPSTSARFWKLIDNVLGIAVSGIVLLSWPLWMWLLWKFTKHDDEVTGSYRILKWLYHGSILQLLVAVPCHVLARKRDLCSAGIQSATAMVIGTVVALISLGPAMLILFSARFQEIKAREFPDLYERFSTVKWSALVILGVCWAVVLFFFAQPSQMNAILVFYAMTIAVVVGRAFMMSKNRRN